MTSSPVKKSTKTKQSAKQPQHPTYNQMIKAALMALKDRTGSSRQAIIKYIKANYSVGDNVEQRVKAAIKRLTTANLLVHTKGTGASGSFKLSQEAKKQTKPTKKPRHNKSDKQNNKPADKKPKKPLAKKTTKSPSKKTKQPTKTKQGTKKSASNKTLAKTPANKLQQKKTANKKTAKKSQNKPVNNSAAKKTVNKPTAKN